MRAFFVEVADVGGDPLFGLGHRLVRMPVHFLLLQAAPEALHVHVVEPATLAVHRDAHAVRLQRAGERFRRELRPLVRIENLWRAVATDRLLERIDAKIRLQRVRDAVRKHLAALTVDCGHEIKEA